MVIWIEKCFLVIYVSQQKCRLGFFFASFANVQWNFLRAAQQHKTYCSRLASFLIRCVCVCGLMLSKYRINQKLIKFYSTRGLHWQTSSCFSQFHLIDLKLLKCTFSSLFWLKLEEITSSHDWFYAVDDKSLNLFLKRHPKIFNFPRLSVCARAIALL